MAAFIMCRGIFVGVFCAVASISFAAQNLSEQTSLLIQQGRTDDFLGNSSKAINEFRQALMIELSNPAMRGEKILETFNLYGESYSHIGLFSISQDRDKDEKLLRAIAEYAVQKKNIQMAQMTHGLLLIFGEKKFGIPSKGIQYSYLRADPLEPTCTLEKPLPSIVNVSELDKLEPCQQKRAFFNIVNPEITPEVKAYRKFEIDFFNQAVRPSI
ncbi:MAG: hypothetical protein KGO49_13820 [Gammaproteobacteria bacterium]|nr:hypothetical protein [Gammaproteobacteria bacterium]